MLEPLANWSDPAKRRLWAVKAAHERDEARLIELLEAYLFLKGRKKALVSPETLRTYRTALRDYLAWAWPEGAPGPRVPLLKATGDDLDRYLSELQTTGGHLPENARPLKPASVATYLAGVRAFYRALEWAGAAVAPDDVHAPADPTPREERRPALPLELYRQLLEHLDDPDDAGKLRDRAMVRLMAEAGLRISEVIHLDEADLLDAERLLVVRSGKGGKQRTVPITRALAAELRDWRRLRRAYAEPGESALFVNTGGRKNRGRRLSASLLRKRLARYYEELGFPPRYRGAHMLRHTAGTRFYRATGDLHVTARLLGHANVNTSAIYAKMDLEGLRDAVDRLEDEA
ncbi:tyrosine-type recombinase/integrase [Oceanithermus sp.]|uniref:tyrosine-type recombinase/integrase n=1 Tax=Oceanithermus sp. TaxID=2268145 RepID=UPI00257BE6F2|nr:tyrosine-type recombinase/integrase [Oceanithermus sp.]